MSVDLDLRGALLKMAVHELREASRAIADGDHVAFVLHTREARCLGGEEADR